MKSLDTLIKLAKRQLDAKKKLLGELLRKKEIMEMAVKTIDDEVAAETALADNNINLASHLAGYRKKQQIKRDAAIASILETEMFIKNTEEEIYTAFTELKKLEIAKASRLRKQTHEANRRDNISLDETGINAYTRNQNPES